MESITYLKNIRVSAKKMRFILIAVKKKGPAEAMKYLFYSRTNAGRVLYKALKSAITNAIVTLKTTDDLLQFRLLAVEEGSKIKRSRPGGRGTAKPIERKISHIKIILVTREVLQSSPKKKEETTVKPSKKRVVKNK